MSDRRTCKTVTGDHRRSYANAVWELYQRTYGSIGMHLADPSDLLKRDVWRVCTSPTGAPNSFALAKRTPFGLKMSLIGSNGTIVGKRNVVDMIQQHHSTPGSYGEVSHKVENIALASGAPAVCAVNAQTVLSDDVIAPEPDRLHYRRQLGILGDVRKLMVGHPAGIPTTDSTTPKCLSGMEQLADSASGVETNATNNRDEIIEQLSLMIGLE